MSLTGVALRTDARGNLLEYDQTVFGSTQRFRNVLLVDHPFVVPEGSRQGPGSQQDLKRWVVARSSCQGNGVPVFALVVRVMQGVHILLGAIFCRRTYRPGDEFSEVVSHPLATTLKGRRPVCVPGKDEKPVKCTADDPRVRAVAGAWARAVWETQHKVHKPDPDGTDEWDRQNGFFLEFFLREPQWFLRPTCGAGYLHKLFRALLSHCFHAVHVRACLILVCSRILDGSPREQTGWYWLVWRLGMFEYTPPERPCPFRVLLPHGWKHQNPETYWKEFALLHSDQWWREGVILERAKRFDSRIWKECALGGRCAWYTDPSQPLAKTPRYIVHRIQEGSEESKGHDAFRPRLRLPPCDGAHWDCVFYGPGPGPAEPDEKDALVVK